MPEGLKIASPSFPFVVLYVRIDGKWPQEADRKVICVKATDLIDVIKMKKIVGTLTADLTINAISQDSRAIQPGDLFICIEGTQVDGHRYVEKAAANGASLIVARKDIQAIAGDVPVVYVSDTGKAMSLLANRFYDYPSEAMQVIGVTGTNGKTTVTYLVEAILKGLHHKTGLMGTIEMHVGDEVIKTKNTTPDSITMQQSLRQMVDMETEYFTLELSSIALEMGRAWGLDVDVAIMTNLTHEHMEFHHTMEAYAESKKLIFSQLGNGRKNGRTKTAVLNADDETIHSYRIATAAEVISYSVEDETADFFAANISYSQTQTHFDLIVNGESYPVVTNLVGLYNVSNTLAALAAVYATGIALEDATKAVANLEGVAGRLEIVPGAQDIGVYVDFAHSPDAMEKVLSVVREFTKGRLISVFGGAGEREHEKRPIMARIGTELSDHVVLTTDDTGKEPQEQIIEMMIAGIEKDNYEYIENREEAILHAIAMAEPEDTVIILGRGHESDYNDKGTMRYLLDSEVAARAIAARNAKRSR